MQLTDPQEIDHIFIEVIQQFNFRWLLVKENLGATAKRFDVTRMPWDKRDDFSGYPIFAAQIGQWSNHGMCVIYVEFDYFSGPSPLRRLSTA